MNSNTNSVTIGTKMTDANMQTGEPVRIGYDALCNHLHLLAGTGSGKTTIMKNIFQQVVAAGHGCHFITPAPDGIRESIALVPRNRLGDVILIDPADTEYPFAASQLALPDRMDAETVKTAVGSAVNRMLRICKKIWGPGSNNPSWGPQLENVLKNCLYTLTLSNLTISELPLLLRDEGFRRFVLAGIPQDLREQFRWNLWFWERDYAQWNERFQQERTESTLNKVLDFLTNQSIENIVGQKTNTLTFQEWMNKPGGKIILIGISENAKGLGDEAIDLLGVMVMAQIKEAVFARGDMDKSERKFHPVLCDEFELFAGDDFKTLLVRGRELNVPFITAHQDMAQLNTEALREAVNQTGNKVTGAVTAADARQFAPLYTSPPLAERIDERKTEEVSGHRAVRTLKGDVVGHLLHQGHEDRRVTAFTDGCLRILHQASLKRIDDHRYEGGYPKNFLGIEYDPERIPEIVAELNTWLFAGMQDRSALWQSLPLGTHWYLLYFFGITRYSEQHQYQYWPGHHLWYEPASYHASKDQGHAVKRWQALRSNGYAEEAAHGYAEVAAYSGISQERLVNAAVAAIEAAYVDFLSSLFPLLTPAGIREAWRQSGVRFPACTLDQMRVRSLRAYKRILAAILDEANRWPELAASSYTRRFLEELSQPRNAVELFLPALHDSYCIGTSTQAYRGELLYDVGNNVRAWRTLGRVKTAGAPADYVKHRGGFVLTGRFTYHPELLSDNILLQTYQGMQMCLPSFLSSLRLFALLHCAQLALSQQPIWTMDSGVYEENKHTSTHFLTTPRQSPTEVAGLMETELINLEPLTAWCRVQDLSAPPGERIKKQKIQIPFPVPLVTGQDLQEQIEQVRSQSQKLIAPRPASEVAAEIRGRVALLREAAAKKEVPTRTSQGEKRTVKDMPLRTGNELGGSQEQRPSRRASGADM